MAQVTRINADYTDYSPVSPVALVSPVPLVYNWTLMGAPYSIKKILSLWPVWLLAALLVSVFWEAVIPPSASWVLSRPEGDVSTLYYYWRGFGFGELSGGTVPLWNPYIFCGSPFAAYPEAALFYPLNLIFTVFSLPAALNWSTTAMSGRRSTRCAPRVSSISLTA